MSEVSAGLLNALDIGKRLRFETAGGYWGTEAKITVDGIITNIQHKKNGHVRVQIAKKDVDGLRFGHNLEYSRFDQVVVPDGVR